MLKKWIGLAIDPLRTLSLEERVLGLEARMKVQEALTEGHAHTLRVLMHERITRVSMRMLAGTAPLMLLVAHHLYKRPLGRALVWLGALVAFALATDMLSLLAAHVL